MSIPEDPNSDADDGAGPGDAFERWLGPASERYFGSGFRQVEQRLDDVTISPLAGDIIQVDADARVLGWKRRGVERVDHLGTIDAIVIGATLASLALIAAGRAAQGRESELVSVRVHAGKAAVLATEKIATSAVWSDTVAHDGLERIRSTIGNIDLDLVARATAQAAIRPSTFGRAKVDEMLGASPNRYFAGGYRQRRLEATSIQLAGSRIGCEFVTDTAGPLGVIECLTLTSQLAQVLLFNAVATKRETTGNMWMRRCEFIALPVRDAQPGRAELAITKLTEIRRGSAHIVSAEVRIDSFPGWTGTAALAFGIIQDAE